MDMTCFTKSKEKKTIGLNMISVIYLGAEYQFQDKEDNDSKLSL